MSSRWTFEHAVDSEASPEDVWAWYSEPDAWPLWLNGVEWFELDGPFAAGTIGRLTFSGRPPLSYRLIDVRPGEGFIDETTVPDGSMTRIRYAVRALADGGCRITQSVEVNGPTADHIGSAIAADIPGEMATLARLAAAGPPPSR